MYELGNIGLVEMLIIAGVCVVCALPVVVGSIAVIIVLIGRNKQGPS